MHRVKAKFAPFRVGATNFAFEIQLNIIKYNNEVNCFYTPFENPAKKNKTFYCLKFSFPNPKGWKISTRKKGKLFEKRLTPAAKFALFIVGATNLAAQISFIIIKNYRSF